MPASDSVVSGRYACAKLDDGTSLYEITGWTMSESEDDVNYVSCETDGLRRRVDGNTDASGTLSGVYNSDTGKSIHSTLSKGDAAVLHLFIRKPTALVAGVYHEVPVKILSVEETADVEGPSVHRWTANWVLSTTTANPTILRDQVAAALGT